MSGGRKVFDDGDLMHMPNLAATLGAALSTLLREVPHAE